MDNEAIIKHFCTKYEKRDRKEYHKEYYRKNCERIKAYQKEYYLEHGSECNRRSREYYRKKKEAADAGQQEK